MSKKFNPWARHQSRRALVQALYQWQLTAALTEDLEQQFLKDTKPRRFDREFFSKVLHGVLIGHERMDKLYSPYLDRQISELDQVEKAILRLGTYELSECLDIPFRVVVDEYIELAKTFGAEDSFKYINGILDSVGHELREYR